MDIRNGISHIAIFTKRHLPAILTGFGMIGVPLTAFIAGKATLEANKKIKEETKKKGEKLTKTETAKVIYPYYLPVAVAGVSTMACIYMSNKSAASQLATAITAARNIEQQVLDNRTSVENVFGKKGLRKVDENINERYAREYFLNEHIYETGHGSTLCCEGFLTGMLFHADREWVRKCVNDFNARLIDGEILSYNEFLQMLIPTIDWSLLPKAGDLFGYNLDIRRRTLEIVEDSFLTQDTREPGYVFHLLELPLMNYTVQYY